MSGEVARRTILLLAPQPFFQNRGTPIAVRLLAEELARLGHDIHLLVFHEGENVALPGVTLHRIPALPGIKDIPPSLSAKKVVCDVAMLFSAIRLMRRHHFDLVHAVEEAAFLAMALRLMFTVPYVYDMDSSLARQVVEKVPALKFLGPVLRFCEKRAVAASCGVVAVCQALEDIARACAPGKPVLRLEDISLLEGCPEGSEDLRRELRLEGPMMLYVGNLERYQGIDLLLDGFHLARQRGCQGHVVLIGGTPAAIAFYRRRCVELGLSDVVHFCGPRPVELLGHYLRQADILLSPRISGNNTPMKLYSYLDSGKAVLATDLPTHTQVLSADFARLAPATAEGMAAAMADLLGDRQKCLELGCRGRQVARDNYSLDAYRQKLQGFYGHLLATLPPSTPSSAKARS